MGQETVKKVAFWGRDRSACTWYRIYLPGRALAARNPAGYILLDGAENSHKLDLVIENADAFVLGRVFAPEVLRFIDLAHRNGQKVIYDIDDNPFRVSPFNNFYAHMGTKEHFLDLGDRSRPLWFDGLDGFDSRNNAGNVAMMTKILSTADGVTVTTHRLAEALGAFNKKVAVVPNCLHMAEWPPDKAPHPGIRLCLQGGSSHVEDWFIIKPVLKELWADPDFAERHWLVIAGSDFQSITHVVPGNRLIQAPWVDVAAHSYRMSTLGIDIALIPLAANEFNECKSVVKWVEMGAMKVPSIMSNVPPYSDEVRNGVDGVLVENDPEAWVKAVRELSDNVSRRSLIGGAAYDTVAQRFQVEQNLDAWEKAIGWITGD